MNVLFVHNNFPAQYKHLAQALARDPRFRVAAIGSATARPVAGVRLSRYALAFGDMADVHPFSRRFDVECRRAEQVLYSLSSLRASDFLPDVIFAHPGWGETLPLRTFFPSAHIVLYCEFYYGSSGRDVGFDPEFPAIGLDGHVNLQLKNATTLLALADCDQGISPTQWQRATFPERFRNGIDVLHDGIDIDVVKPASDAGLHLSSGCRLTAADEVVTFVARNLEPLRGYHIFMRSLPRVLSARPDAHVVIVGADGAGYGPSPPPGTTWRERFLADVADRIDPGRVHFTGPLPYRAFLSALQISSAHVYLTYPFVLSWSLLEAMSAGCAVVASDTAPVTEVIDGHNGLLVPFFDADRLAETIVEVLAHPERYRSMRERARQHVIDHYDLRRTCLPSAMALLDA